MHSKYRGPAPAAESESPWVIDVVSEDVFSSLSSLFLFRAGASSVVESGGGWMVVSVIAVDWDEWNGDEESLKLCRSSLSSLGNG